MIINTNTGAADAARLLADTTSALQKSLKRLSTGSRIASVSDDAGGSGVAYKFSAQLSRLNASRDNVSNALSLAQTQEGYLDKVAGALERMSELAMLATDQTKSNADRALYQKELEELRDYITDVTTKDFNGTSLFSGATLTVTLGTTQSGTATTLGVTGLNLGATSYVTVASSSSSFAVGTAASAAASLVAFQTAIGQLASDRAQLGANISRLETEKNTLSILRDNLSAARSRIVDVDVAEESANFARQQILVQSGTAMLAQANILPQSALRLMI